ncbi:hypothetical protein ACP275_09G050900 [Erythranthe tilingii]
MALRKKEKKKKARDFPNYADGLQLSKKMYRIHKRTCKGINEEMVGPNEKVHIDHFNEVVQLVAQTKGGAQTKNGVQTKLRKRSDQRRRNIKEVNLQLCY